MRGNEELVDFSGIDRGIAKGARHKLQLKEVDETKEGEYQAEREVVGPKDDVSQNKGVSTPFLVVTNTDKDIGGVKEVFSPNHCNKNPKSSHGDDGFKGMEALKSSKLVEVLVVPIYQSFVSKKLRGSIEKDCSCGIREVYLDEDVEMLPHEAEIGKVHSCQAL
ncbi:hypothetical protein PTKIN_Ptkin13bG0018700 [Pterospermum kingtungense]